MSARTRRDVALGCECAWPNPYAPLSVSGRRRGAWWRRLRFGASIALLALGAWALGQSVWVQANDWLAQKLIVQAWSRTLAGERQVKPWPWAETWPVARLSVPALGIERYVLAGSSGAATSFGPGHLEGTAIPGDDGNSVIGGNRDTQLAFLRHLPVGSRIQLESPNGARRSYTVRHVMVLDQRDVWIAKQEGPARLTLITGYPFDALRTAGAQRLVVSAFASAARNTGVARGNAPAPLLNRGGERAARG